MVIHSDPHKSDIADSHMRTHGFYYDEEQTLLYYNTKCPTCPNANMTVTVKLLMDMEHYYETCKGIVSTSCEECDWTFYSSRNIICHKSSDNNNTPNEFWTRYVNEWNIIHEKKLEFYKVCKFNEKLLIWELNLNPNVPVCPECKSNDIIMNNKLSHNVVLK